MNEDLRKMWKKSIKDLPTVIDLGRLAKRIDVFIMDDESETSRTSIDRTTTDITLTERSNSSPRTKPTENSSRAEALGNTIEVVANRLETVSRNIIVIYVIFL